MKYDEKQAIVVAGSYLFISPYGLRQTQRIIYFSGKIVAIYIHNELISAFHGVGLGICEDFRSILSLFALDRLFHNQPSFMLRFPKIQ
ncbi:MAG: hypothetical protein NC210_07630 [[Clostridium] fimetarium]|nr:hypothetical protein [[Clostridium] fimetarium]